VDIVMGDIMVDGEDITMEVTVVTVVTAVGEVGALGSDLDSDWVFLMAITEATTDTDIPVTMAITTTTVVRAIIRDTVMTITGIIETTTTIIIKTGTTITIMAMAMAIITTTTITITSIPPVITMVILSHITAKSK